MSKTFYQLTDCDNGSGGAGAWIPSEKFSDFVLRGIYQKGDISDSAVVIGADLGAGDGDTFNVRMVTKRSDACATTGCGNCLSTSSTTFSDVAIDIAQYGDMDTIANYADWQAKGDVIGSVAMEVSGRLAHCRDKGLWTALCGATPNTTITTTASWSSSRILDTSCCTFGYDVYNAIVDARQHLMGDGYNPDYVLIHPYAASFLYYKEGHGGGGYPFQNMPLLKFGDDGYLASIAGLKVIEVKAAVADDADPSDGGDETAVVIDSSRALVEVWGQRPKFHEFYDGQCNSTELTVWMYWGCDTADDDAIVHIENP